ncbi:hypothetical protein E5176_12765 [Ensifer adhaerens]|nr:hypothetical protein E5176_12765 [Ensifer adhaerens]
MYVEKAEQKEPAISSCGFYEVIGRGGPPDAPSAIRRQGRCFWPCLSFTILCSAKLCLEIVAAHNYCTTYRSAAPPPAAPDADRRHSSSQLPIKFESPVYLLPHGALFILRLCPRLSAHRRDAAHRLPNLPRSNGSPVPRRPVAVLCRYRSTRESCYGFASLLCSAARTTKEDCHEASIHRLRPRRICSPEWRSSGAGQRRLCR